MNRSPQVDNLHNFHLEDKARHLNFGSAMNAVANGGKVRRLEWKDENVYISINKETVVIFKTEDSQLHPLIVSLGDITGTDWVVVKTEETLH